jgi:hypothetical protein
MYLIKKGNDPKFWSEEVRNKDCYKAIRESLFKSWEKSGALYDIPILKYSEFKLYGTIGNRVIFEKPYFERRGHLETAAMLSLIYPENEEYFTYLEDLIFDICNEFTWTLPAHQPDILSSTDITFIDLFNCETAGTLSEIYVLLEDRLDPLIKNRIKLEVNRRVVQPYLDVVDNPKFPWWRGGYTGNWVAVCTANIATSILHLFPEYYETVKPDWDRLIVNFLKGFSDNGFCDEGPGYWGYGFGFFVIYADLIYNFTNGEVDYFKDPKVKKIATYLQKMYLSGKCCVSFSDSGRHCTYILPMLHYLKKKYPEDVKVYTPEYADILGGKISVFRSALWFDEQTYFNPTADDEPAEYYDSDYQWLIKRTRTFGFAAKAGFNEEHHNHNDVGSFIFARNGEQVFCDMGSGVYTKQYGDPALAYASNEISSSWHSLPIVNGNYQRRGRQFASKDVSFENGVFTMDIAGAYGLEELKSCKRTFIAKDDSIVIKDLFTCESGTEIIERFTLLEKPTINGCEGSTANSLFTFNEDVADITVIEKKNSRTTVYYTLDFKLKPGVSEFEITIK